MANSSMFSFPTEKTLALNLYPARDELFDPDRNITHVFAQHAGEGGGITHPRTHSTGKSQLDGIVVVQHVSG